MHNHLRTTGLFLPLAFVIQACSFSGAPATGSASAVNQQTSQVAGNSAAGQALDPAVPQLTEITDTPGATGVAQSLPQSCTAPSADERRFPLSAPLVINERYLGDISVNVTASGQGDVDVARLVELLSPLLTRAQAEDLADLSAGQEQFPLADFCNGPVQVQFDMSSLQVEAFVDTGSLQVQQIGLSGRPSPNPDSFYAPQKFASGLGAIVTQQHNLDPAEGETQGGVLANFEGYTNFGGFSGASLFYSFEVDEDRDHVFRRREVQLIKDFYDSALRLTVGELNSTTKAFQSTSALMGFTLGKDYQTIQPFQNILSTGRGSLVLDRTSTVDVYVNGVLNETLELPPGQFELTDFPSATGSNDVELVVRDELGREETTTFSFFSQSRLLGEGLANYGFTAGVPRTAKDSGFDYGDKPVVSTFVEYGATSWLTLGSNFQVHDQRAQAGLAATVGTNLGTFTMEASASRVGDSLDTTFADREGVALFLGYRQRMDIGSVPVNVDFSAESKSEDFTGLGTSTPRNNKLLANAAIRFQLAGDYNLSFTANKTEPHGINPARTRFGFTFGKSLGFLSLSISANHQEIEGLDSSLSGVVSLTYRIGDRYSLRSSYGSDDEVKSLEWSRAGRPQIDDINGRLRYTESNSLESIRGSAGYRHNRFDANIDYEDTERFDALTGDSSGSSRSATWRLASFLGYTNGAVALGRPSPEGFIIASKHSTLRDSAMNITRSGRMIDARTGLLGPALIPVQRAYFPQQQGIDVDPLPTGYDLGAGEISVLPGIGVGYSLTVGSDASRTILGRLNNADGEPVVLLVGSLVPENGDAELERQLFTNSTGRFVAERVAAGSYRIIIDGAQSDVIVIEEDSEGVVNVGTIILP